MFKFFTSLHVFLFRISGGKLGGDIRGFKVLLLTTQGRKSGVKRTNPLGYFEDNGNFVIIASNGGRDTHPAWFFNLKSNPQVSVEVPGKTLNAVAKPADAENRKRLWDKLIQAAPLYARYEQRTTREIPLVVLRPLPGS